MNSKTLQLNIPIRSNQNNQQIKLDGLINDYNFYGGLTKKEKVQMFSHIVIQKISFKIN